MSAEYPVKCACGRTHQVAAGAAGSHFACGCGRQVEVPSLHALRLQAGEAAVSAEMMITAMLHDGELPEEKDCLRCGEPTANLCHVSVVCERPELRKESAWRLSVLWLLFGWMVFSRSREEKVLGRDVQFRLPLRVCAGCASRLGRAEVLELMRQVPLYGQLLHKYPHAAVSLAPVNA